MNIEEKELLRSISEVQFAYYECSLYLDTHPFDREAAAKAKEYKAELDRLTAVYKMKYGPLTLSPDFDGGSYEWAKGPWPWEKEAN